MEYCYERPETPEKIYQILCYFILLTIIFCIRMYIILQPKTLMVKTTKYVLSDKYQFHQTFL